MMKYFKIFIFQIFILSSCIENNEEFSIQYPYINNQYLIWDVAKESNLVTDSLIINIVQSIFPRDKSTPNYGNWYSYYLIENNNGRALVLRFANDDVYDEILICKCTRCGNVVAHHVAREYGDGEDFENISSVIKGNVITITKTIEHASFNTTTTTYSKRFHECF